MLHRVTTVCSHVCTSVNTARVRICAGKRSDNRRKQREGDMTCHGYRFFVEDEDMYCLEDTLQVRPPHTRMAS